MSRPTMVGTSKPRKHRQQLHISGINCLASCGQQFMYRYMMGLRKSPSSYVLVGKSTDESVSRNLDHKIEYGELMKRSDVLDIAATTFDREQKNDPVVLDQDEKDEGLTLETVLGEAKDKAVSLAGLHHDEAAPNIRAVRTRRKFSINMDDFLRSRASDIHRQANETADRHTSKTLHNEAVSLNAAARVGIDFAGEQDIQEEYDGALIIRDTKTSVKSPTPSVLDGAKDQGVADKSEQLTAYAVASHVIDGKLPDLMVLDYLVQTKAKKPTIKYVPTMTRRDMADVNVFLARFASAIHAMRSGVFMPANPEWWGCSQKYCAYYEICPYAKKPKLVQITTAVPK